MPLRAANNGWIQIVKEETKRKDKRKQSHLIPEVGPLCCFVGGGFLLVFIAADEIPLHQDIASHSRDLNPVLRVPTDRVRSNSNVRSARDVDAIFPIAQGG